MVKKESYLEYSRVLAAVANARRFAETAMVHARKYEETGGDIPWVLEMAKSAQGEEIQVMARALDRRANGA